MKEKVKVVPKELVRRGLDDGTERLRGQLRETAQRGQASDYGGDRIEDTAVGGARRAGRGVEALLKKKKRGKERIPDEDPNTAADSSAQEPPAEPSAAPESQAERPSPHEPSPREQPHIKTRETMTAREGGTASASGDGAKSSPSAGSERLRIRTKESVDHDAAQSTRQAARTKPECPRIRTREVAGYDAPSDVGSAVVGKPDRFPVRPGNPSVHDACTVIDSVPQSKPELLQIRTKEAVTGVHPDRRAATTPPDGRGPPERRSVKTRDTYIQKQAAADPEQSAQAFTQGRQKFMQERSRSAAMKQAEALRTGRGSAVQAQSNANAGLPSPIRRGYAGSQSKYAPTRTVHSLPHSGGHPSQSIRDGGQTIVKTARSGRKVTKHAARQTIKTAEWSSRKAVKTAQKTAKTAQQMAKAAQKTAQATVKATQRAVQAARATAKAAAATAKAAAKATVAAIKAAVAAMQELIAAIAAGGWVVLVVVLVICMIGLLIASPFGIFFSDGNTPDAVSPTEAIAQINGEYADMLSTLQAGGTYDRVEIQGRPPAWADVFAVFAAKITGAENGAAVAVLDADRIEDLRIVFWDMTKITTAEEDIEHPAEGDTPAWTEKVLTITVTPRTPDDMRVFYLFTDQQNAALDELLTEEARDLWNNLLYGSSGEIVVVALSQVGNVGGQPYWSWYGFNSRENWCACFVSWCADQCGYIDAGVIPKFASCTIGSNWFKERGQWQDGGCEPRPGDLIFFDWDNKGSSGPQDDIPDHVGIVERVESGVVYTVEGNSGDRCRQNAYSVAHYEIWGYATPIY